MSTRFLNWVASRAVITLSAALYLGTAGCGGGDDDDTTATGGGGSGGTEAGQAGAGTQAGTGGGGSGAAGRSQDDAGQPVICGGKQCTLPSESPLEPCCVKDNICGAKYQNECQEVNQEGVLDSRCPSHTIQSFNNMALPGCCKPNGKCGVYSSFGFGCVERTQLASFSGGPLPARDCNAKDEDAGN
jgi:hypothetical protein